MSNEKSLDGFSKEGPINLTADMVLANIEDVLGSNEPEKDPPPGGGSAVQQNERRPQKGA